LKEVNSTDVLRGNSIAPMNECKMQMDSDVDRVYITKRKIIIMIVKKKKKKS